MPRVIWKNIQDVAATIGSLIREAHNIPQLASEKLAAAAEAASTEGDLFEPAAMEEDVERLEFS